MKQLQSLVPLLLALLHRTSPQSSLTTTTSFTFSNYGLSHYLCETAPQLSMQQLDLHITESHVPVSFAIFASLHPRSIDSS